MGGRGGVKYDAVTFHLLRLVDPSSSDGTIHLCILTGVKKRKRKVLRVKNRLMKLHTKSPNLHNTNGKRSTPVDLDGINIIKEDDARDGHTDAESRASLSLVRTIRAQLRMEHLPPPPPEVALQSLLQPISEPSSSSSGRFCYVLMMCWVRF